MFYRTLLQFLDHPLSSLSLISSTKIFQKSKQTHPIYTDGKWWDHICQHLKMKFKNHNGSISEEGRRVYEDGILKQSCFGFSQNQANATSHTQN